MTIREPSVLYAALPPSERPPFGDEESAREVVFDSGVSVEVVPYDLFASGDTQADYEALSVRAVAPDERGLCFLPEGAQPDQLFAFSPEMSVLGEGAGVKFENRWGYTADDSIGIWLLGVLIAPSMVNTFLKGNGVDSVRPKCRQMGMSSRQT